MLFAKISPSATIASQLTPFTFAQLKGEYMTAIANQYAPNSEFTQFTVIFGNFSDPVPVTEPQPLKFVSLYSYNLTLTAQQLSSWGTNDAELLTIIAEDIGTTITEFVNVPEITGV